LNHLDIGVDKYSLLDRMVVVDKYSLLDRMVVVLSLCYLGHICLSLYQDARLLDMLVEVDYLGHTFRLN
jgi:hypothetical protein